jgi:tyrosyl-tRNA synthetase
MSENVFLSVFEGVPVFDVGREIFAGDVSIADLFAEHTKIFSSKGEVRRLIQGGGISLNKEKIDNADKKIGLDYLLNNKYMLVQKGKKNYFLIRINN